MERNLLAMAPGHNSQASQGGYRNKTASTNKSVLIKMASTVPT